MTASVPRWRFEAPLLALVLWSSPCLAVNLQDAVVGVYGVMADSPTSQGSGFFISPEGRLVTAYHVVVDAESILIAHRQRLFDDISIVAISPSHDLVELQINSGEPQRYPYLELGAHSPDLPSGRDVVTLGWPRNIPGIRVSGEIAREDFLDSRTLRDASGKQLFRTRLDLLMLDITAHDGMSGGPVLSDERVVGVLNGSLVEGGSVAWAIPTGYVRELQPFRVKSEDVGEWPEFTMVRGDWNDLRSWYSYNVEGRRTYEKFKAFLNDALEARRAWKAAVRAIDFGIPKTHMLREAFSRRLVDESQLSVAENEVLMEFIGRSARKRKALKVAYDRLLRAHEGVVEFSRSLPSQLDADEPDGSSDRSESYPGHVLAAQVEADRLLASASRRMGEEEELMQELRMIEQNVRELYDDIGRFPRSSSGRKGAVNRYLGAYDEMVEQTQEFVIRAVAGRTAIDQSIEGYLKLGVRYEFELFG